MGFPSAPEWAGSISLSKSPFPNIGVSPPLKTTRKPRGASGAGSRTPKSSRMSWDSMDDPSTASWIASLRAGRVSRIALLASAAEQPTNDGSGTTSPESSTSAEHLSFSVKTFLDFSAIPIALLTLTKTWMNPQTTLLAEWEPFSGIWPKWGLCLRGEVYELPRWEPPMDAIESSFWPTTRAKDSESTGAHGTNLDSLTSATQYWRTPETRSVGPSWHQIRIDLDGQTAYWRTPSAGHPEKGGSQHPEKRLASGHTLDLQDQAEYWPTPANRDSRDPNSMSYQERTGTTKGEQLPNFVAHQWKTPHGLQYKPEEGDPGGGGEFAEQATHFSPPVHPILPGLTFSERVRILLRLCRRLRRQLRSPYNKGRSIFKPKLNPNFVD